MSGNTFGTLFTVTSFGESHGPAIGCVVDGCPPGLALCEADIQAEYAKAPEVTRQRLYLETMQQIYSNVTKVLVESRQGSNLLYLPLDKIMQGVSQTLPAATPEAPPAGSTGTAAPSQFPSDSRITRDPNRSRERESR